MCGVDRGVLGDRHMCRSAVGPVCHANIGLAMVVGILSISIADFHDELCCKYIWTTPNDLLFILILGVCL